MYYRDMEITFTSDEVAELRSAWGILAPKIDQWLTQANLPNSSGSELPRLYWRDFIKPVKDVLNAAPGRSLRLDQLYQEVETRMRPRLLVRDRKTLNSGVVRWKTFVNQVGVELRKQGYLDPNEDRGVWRVV